MDKSNFVFFFFKIYYKFEMCFKLINPVLLVKNEDFAMEWQFVIWLYPPFYNVISLNKILLKLFLISS